MGRGGVIFIGLAACGLLTAGCSSGSPAVTKATIAATAATTATTATTAKVTTETVRVGRLTEIFATPLPADSAQASVIEGFRTGLILWDRSQEEQRLVPPVTSDVTGAALVNLKKSLTRELTPGQLIVPAGSDRNFKTRVTALTGASATVTTCDDGSKFEEVNPGTGVVNKAYSATTPDQEYIFVTWQMTRLDGHWAISVVAPVSLPNALAKPCQPLPG